MATIRKPAPKQLQPQGQVGNSNTYMPPQTQQPSQPMTNASPAGQGPTNGNAKKKGFSGFVNKSKLVKNSGKS